MWLLVSSDFLSDEREKFINRTELNLSYLKDDSLLSDRGLENKNRFMRFTRMLVGSLCFVVLNIFLNMGLVIEGVCPIG